ncbi:hypothetical protein HPP92_022830 [Vanilla planifolia]|uniref:Uncharacterized protein n=1 Tax=Vanilla planifolia TaxID=51239 RepID=A0A835UDW9_VANPL|nr:hypothetical protein HPP92_022830 [Vanilla planifolia]
MLHEQFLRGVKKAWEKGGVASGLQLVEDKATPQEVKHWAILCTSSQAKVGRVLKKRLPKKLVMRAKRGVADPQAATLQDISKMKL